MSHESPLPNYSVTEFARALVALGSDADLPSVLRRLLGSAVSLTNATYGAIGVLDETKSYLSEFITEGIDASLGALIGELPHGQGVLGLLISDAREVMIDDIALHPTSVGFPPHHPKMRSFLGMPIVSGGEIFGNLYLADKVGAPSFVDDDAMVVQFLAQGAGIAIDNARLRERALHHHLTQDRLRIAQDLHDDVIQRLFGLSISLQGASGVNDPQQSNQAIEGAVDEISNIINEIRSTISNLHRNDEGGDLGGILSSLAQNLAQTYGLPLQIVVSSATPKISNSKRWTDLVHITREAISNMAKHANPTIATMSVEFDHDVVLTFSNNGITAPMHQGTGYGLLNIKSRAQRHGGSASSEVSNGFFHLKVSIPL